VVAPPVSWGELLATVTRALLLAAAGGGSIMMRWPSRRLAAGSDFVYKLSVNETSCCEKLCEKL
jgi:hypothetical protein